MYVLYIYTSVSDCIVLSECSDSSCRFCGGVEYRWDDIFEFEFSLILFNTEFVVFSSFEEQILVLVSLFIIMELFSLFTVVLFEFTAVCCSCKIVAQLCCTPKIIVFRISYFLLRK